MTRTLSTVGALVLLCSSALTASAVPVTFTLDPPESSLSESPAASSSIDLELLNPMSVRVSGRPVKTLTNLAGASPTQALTPNAPGVAAASRIFVASASCPPDVCTEGFVEGEALMPATEPGTLSLLGIGILTATLGSRLWRRLRARKGALDRPEVALARRRQPGMPRARDDRAGIADDQEMPQIERRSVMREERESRLTRTDGAGIRV